MNVHTDQHWKNTTLEETMATCVGRIREDAGLVPSDVLKLLTAKHRIADGRGLGSHATLPHGQSVKMIRIRFHPLVIKIMLHFAPIFVKWAIAVILGKTFLGVLIMQ